MTMGKSLGVLIVALALVGAVFELSCLAGERPDARVASRPAPVTGAVEAGPPSTWEVDHEPVTDLLMLAR